MIKVQDLRPQIDALTRDFGALQQKQVPYALMKTINATLQSVQRVERVSLARTYKLRRPDFIERLVYIGPNDWATKARPIGRVGFQGTKADLIAKFERGGLKVSPSGQAVWVPGAARRSRSGVIGRQDRPKGLNLRPVYSSTAKGATIYRGDKRTFMIRYRDGSGLVLQRVGRRARGRKARRAQLNAPVRMNDGTKTLFVYLKRPPTLPANLRFTERAQEVVNRLVESEFRQQMRKALFGGTGSGF